MNNQKNQIARTKKSIMDDRKSVCIHFEEHSESSQSICLGSSIDYGIYNTEMSYDCKDLPLMNEDSYENEIVESPQDNFNSLAPCSESQQSEHLFGTDVDTPSSSPGSLPNDILCH